MPLVAHTSLPAFEKLRQRGEKVLSLDEALHQDIRELNVGLLNMMPDAALSATEIQFMRLVGSSNQIAQFFIHPFTVSGLSRNAKAENHIENHYKSFEDIKTMGLDALIITGANVSNPNLEEEAFWQPLQEVVAWARENVSSILCSCLATHALVQSLYNIKREHMGQKLWGVYPHRVTDKKHPLLRDVNTRFDVPHSRFNQITRAQLEAAGLSVLIESETAGVHLAATQDQYSMVFFQGHPEYDTNSLLKEYKREVLRFINDERADYPPKPEFYFNEAASKLVDSFQAQSIMIKTDGDNTTGEIPTFPEQAIEDELDNTWRDSSKGIINNWLGLVYEKNDFAKHNKT
ncbi:MAG: homoserine O-succinyltransferase [Ghiorsea sp.]